MGSTAGESITPGHATSTRPGVWLTDASLVLMAAVWGVNFVVVKYGTTLVDPLAYNGTRVMLAAVVLAAIIGALRTPLPPRRTIVALLALGALGNGVYQYFFVEGVARTRASDAALVIAASPAFIAIIGRVLGVERVSRRGVLGILLSIAGIGLIVLGSADAARGGGAPLIGDALVLIGSVAWALYTVLLKPYAERVPGLQLNAFTMVGGAVPLFLAALPAIARTSWSRMPAMGWAAILYSGILALVLAYLFWYRGVRVIGPTRTAMYSNLQPVFAVGVAWLVLGEVPTVWQALGAGGIMGGLILTRR